MTAEVNRLQRLVTRRFNEWRNNHWGVSLESLNTDDESLWMMNKRVLRFHTPSPPPGQPWESLSQTLKNRRPCRKSGESVSAGERTSVPAVIEIVDVGLGS